MPDERTIDHSQAPLATQRWFGYLTLENAKAVAERLRLMLDGKPYTWVAVNENMDLLNPEVRTGQRLSATGRRDGAEAITCELDGERAHIMVTDTYGVWGVSTRVPNEREAHRTLGGLMGGTDKLTGAVGLHHMADPERKLRADYDLVYLSFEHDYRGEQVSIKQRTAAGGRITWVVAIDA